MGRKADGNQGVSGRPAATRSQPLPIEKGPFPGLAVIKLPRNGVINCTQDDLPLGFQRNGNSERLQPMDVVGCSIKWIDDPAVFPITKRLYRGSLLRRIVFFS